MSGVPNLIVTAQTGLLMYSHAVCGVPVRNIQTRARRLVK